MGYGMCDLNHAEIDVTISHEIGEMLLDTIEVLGTMLSKIGVEDLEPLARLHTELASAMNLSHGLAATTGAEGFM